MRICYIAQHNSGDNDPEGAIDFALRQLGHQVTCVHERRYCAGLERGHDFVLFHKWPLAPICARGLKVPAVFWHWDKVEDNDPRLADRTGLRVAWMQAVIPHVLCGFCSDGDWVEKVNSLEDYTGREGKLYWLMQGMDERYAGPGEADPSLPRIPLLFIGGAFSGNGGYGTQRVAWVKMMLDRYGSDFQVVGDVPSPRRTVKRDLANLIARADIVVAPDGPSTHTYWSNRCYLTTGMGGFLLHPYCARLLDHFQPIKEIVTYANSDELHKLIRIYREDYPASKRQEIATAGYERTVREHLYRHRCAELIREVERRL